MRATRARKVKTDIMETCMIHAESQAGQTAMMMFSVYTTRLQSRVESGDKIECCVERA